MKLVPLKIAGTFRIELTPSRDERGFFVRTYDNSLFAAQGLVTDWIQESHSFSTQKGTVRGLHIQCAPYGETKLIRVAYGKIFMAFIDLRPHSQTFKQADHIILSAQEPELVYVPKGLAMGMCTLSDNATLLYKMDMLYHPESARTIIWNDPDINIPWPVKEASMMSDRDKNAPRLKDLLAKEKLV